MLLISHAQVCNHGTQVYHVIVCVLYLSKMCVISQISVFCHTCWCYHICHRCMAWMRSVLCRISLCYIIDCMFYVRTHARACTLRARTRTHMKSQEDNIIKCVILASKHAQNKAIKRTFVNIYLH